MKNLLHINNNPNFKKKVQRECYKFLSLDVGSRLLNGYYLRYE